MDTSPGKGSSPPRNDSIIYNANIYCPPSDSGSEGDESYYVMDTVSDLPNTVVDESRNDQVINSIQPDLNTDTGLYEPVTSPPPAEDASESISENSSPGLRHLSPPPPPRPNSYLDIHNTDSEHDNANDENSESDYDDYDDIETQKMSNYPRDTEHELDYADGWEWENTDTTGASYGPFTSQPGLQVEPDGQTPLDYLRLFIPDHMIHHIAEQTNLYANSKQQGM